MSIQGIENQLELENLSYVENMISKLEVGTDVLLGDSQKEGFAKEAKLAADNLKSLSFEEEDGTKKVSLNSGSYKSFFSRMREVMSDVDVYRKKLKENSELRLKQSEIELQKKTREYTNKINFKLWPWVVVSFVLGLGVIFLSMFVIWYFSSGDSQNSNTSNLYNDVFCGGCKSNSDNI